MPLRVASTDGLARAFSASTPRPRAETWPCPACNDHGASRLGNSQADVSSDKARLALARLFFAGSTRTDSGALTAEGRAAQATDCGPANDFVSVVPELMGLTLRCLEFTAGYQRSDRQNRLGMQVFAVARNADLRLRHTC